MRERRKRSPLKIRAELILVVVCVGVISAGPLAADGAKPLVVFWAAAVAMASYLKGRLEPALDERPETRAGEPGQPPLNAKITNEEEDAVPTTRVEPASEGDM